MYYIIIIIIILLLLYYYYYIIIIILLLLLYVLYYWPFNPQDLIATHFLVNLLRKFGVRSTKQVLSDKFEYSH